MVQGGKDYNVQGQQKANLSHDSLWLLVKGYWSANPNGTSSNLKKFLVHVNLAIMRNSACPDGQGAIDIAKIK